MDKNIVITNGSLTASINPLGAELSSLKDSSREYIWQADPKYWPKHSPLLFPIVGCLKNNSYLYKGQMYAMTRHGFARDNIFSVTNQSEDSVTMVLKANGDTKVMYPFEFELEIRYMLKDESIFIDYRVVNTDDSQMPLALGAHPAFALPNKFTNYSLQFEKDEVLQSRQLQDNLLTDNLISHDLENGTLPLNYSLFSQDALVFTGLKSREVTLLEGENAVLSVKYENFPHLGIWTEENAAFICIEPWQGYADKVESTGNIIEKEGMLSLAPGASFTAEIEIEIKNK